jgi:type I restriction enzyme M protein
MAIKKSELYSRLWASADALKGGMDASEYKNYVLPMLFIKYVSDKYKDDPFSRIPPGATFQDMQSLKGSTDIGDRINKQIVGPLWEAYQLNSPPDFNDPEKLGKGKEMVDRLTNLISIFEGKELDFSKNKSDGDDLLGDAYEYLMWYFATESGKSKGQFYTPSEVSRVLAQVIGIQYRDTTPDTTVYDPTCGSGSLLLKVANQASSRVSLYGQEKEGATAGLAKMNMILHNYDTAVIAADNTLTSPNYKENGTLKQFDYVVANPPFSDKRWSTGLDPENDEYDRFADYGTPPDKNGDYAYLLHIIRSLKSRGKGACILPHGVLFRGNAEAVIRKNLINKGLIKGIIGLPANLFYGTGIPACVVVIDKENAVGRQGIYMIDASKGFIKDGNKNRLRERDIHKIVDAFTKGLEIEGYSRMVGKDEIEKNDYNLNIPRYIDGSEEEDLQDIEAHLKGGIPVRDIDALEEYWNVFPDLRESLFRVSSRSDQYLDIKVGEDEIRSTIFEHPQFLDYSKKMEEIFQNWREKTSRELERLEPGFHPKEMVNRISEDLLRTYADVPLMDKYDIYQHLMSYWYETLQDDAYLVSVDGWKAVTYRILEKNNKGKEVDKGWTCDLVPKDLVIKRHFPVPQERLEYLQSELEYVTSRKTEMEEEQGGEDGAFFKIEKVNKGNIKAELKKIEEPAIIAILKEYLEILDQESGLKKSIKELESEMDKGLYDFYPELTVEQIKELVIQDKWMDRLASDIQGEMDRISQRLATRIKELAERYGDTLPELSGKVSELETAVSEHLAKMGFEI